MHSAYHPITVKKGATSDITMALTVDGAPVDLTGYTITMDVRSTPDELGTLILQFTNDPPTPPTTYLVSELIVDAAAGTIQRLLDADTAADLPAGAWHYDMKLASADGTVDYLLYGPFTVARRITP